MPQPNLKGCCWGLTNLTGLTAPMGAVPARHLMRRGVLPGKRVRHLGPPATAAQGSTPVRRSLPASNAGINPKVHLGRVGLFLPQTMTFETTGSGGTVRPPRQLSIINCGG
ncbi:hypothetical protein NtRootA4_02960 [Arthrobacter sp. NtRootA4]|nr:hypothetical protein NtRootA2_05190 [Arthrobacter sp. NtRootA2]BCW13317.1 hypothetical protein NtRootA4_02960 [Arthrobacter sp. NtRootA4]BCW21653.1 hypothetical protein NtRootC7_05200 [Arthrobacter sp. NtRootC7]BCW25920.1 hypothetical protein NtRootC45_05200 [Arthrobacter sp. NtRootC45]BCW30190.1 hypothetical protein NtRootD5_05210 [Arthrobacter sp. NtRootD5]